MTWSASSWTQCLTGLGPAPAPVPTPGLVQSPTRGGHQHLRVARMFGLCAWLPAPQGQRALARSSSSTALCSVLPRPPPIHAELTPARSRPAPAVQCDEIGEAVSLVAYQWSGHRAALVLHTEGLALHCG